MYGVLIGLASVDDWEEEEMSLQKATQDDHQWTVYPMGMHASYAWEQFNMRLCDCAYPTLEWLIL